MTTDELHSWLREKGEERLNLLWRWADAVRHKTVGDEIHLRGLIEFSNECTRRCAYCGLRVTNKQLARYRMLPDEILDCAADAYIRGYGSVVLQSGENEMISATWLGDIIHRIKANYPLAVTLSLGERSPRDLEYWRCCGADRYLLRFETSDRELFKRIHPPRGSHSYDRIDLLRIMAGLGYEIGSGIMVGIPGQTFHSVANDLRLFEELDLDMIGIGPYIPVPGTPLGEQYSSHQPLSKDHVPNNELMARKVIALSRLLCPEANIPATTALAVADNHGYTHGLACGANVIMPDVTPLACRLLYAIYPGRVGDDVNYEHIRILNIIERAHRTPGYGRGDRIRHHRSQAQ